MDNQGCDKVKMQVNFGIRLYNQFPSGQSIIDVENQH
jgi:hypothetical protein